MARQSTAEAKRRHSAEAAPPYLQSLGGLEECSAAMEDMLGGDPNSQISMLLLVSDEDVIKTIQRAAPKVEIAGSAGATSSTAVSLSVKGSSKAKSGRLLVVRTGAPQVYLAITHEGPAFVSTLPAVLGEMCPRAFVPRFSSGEMRSVLELLESKTGLMLTTMRITSHSRAGKKATYRRNEKKVTEGGGRSESEIIHVGVPYGGTIDSSLENGQWIGDAQFTLLEGGDVRLEGYFSRGGLFKFRHSFLVFKRHVLPHILDMGKRRFELYSNRSREDNGGGDASPLVIKLQTDTFDDPEQSRRFIEAVQGMKHTSGSVYRASPYVNMSVVDLEDGSAFKIWIMSPDEITIVPQARATQASFSRLIGHIFERFQEGDVREYE